VDSLNRVSSAGVIEQLPEIMAKNRDAILVIEDCEPLLFYLNTALLTLGYENQYLASNLAEAAAVWLHHKTEIAHILLNYELPDGVSSEFAALAIKERPTVNIVVTSGYDIAVIRESVGHAARFHFLQKPFRLSELKTVLEIGAPKQAPN
jgi:DNA-binding NtrC family response regulator